VGRAAVALRLAAGRRVAATAGVESPAPGEREVVVAPRPAAAQGAEAVGPPVRVAQEARDPSPRVSLLSRGHASCRTTSALTTRLRMRRLSKPTVRRRRRSPGRRDRAPRENSLPDACLARREPKAVPSLGARDRLLISSPLAMACGKGRPFFGGLEAGPARATSGWASGWMRLRVDSEAAYRSRNIAGAGRPESTPTRCGPERRRAR